MKKPKAVLAAAVNLESEGLRLLYEAREGRMNSKPFTIHHGLAVQDYYRKQIDTANLRGLCLEGTHP